MATPIETNADRPSTMPTSELPGGRGMAPESGRERFPLRHVTYDVLTVLQKKAKGLEVYDRYIRDAQSEPEILELLQRLRDEDEEQIRLLKGQLTRLLAEEEDEEDEDARDDGELDDMEPDERGA